ncbi:MAG: hypothetical protein KIT19_06595 [Phycisphaeraceae bacterium]|nr:hypothetical protein [Phycisphaeraceae bacterium]
MSKFKMKLKLTGLEIEVEGNREDIPLMTQNIGSQFAGLLEPAANVVEGESPSPRKVTNDAMPASQVESKPRPSRKKRNGGGGGGGSRSTLEIKPDHELWGVPTQDWTGTDKSIWLLQVLAGNGHTDGGTANEISTLFNEHFLTAGKLSRQNVDTLLRKVANGSEALVVRSNNGKFSLTQKGLARAATLVSEVKPKAEV